MQFSQIREIEDNVEKYTKNNGLLLMVSGVVSGLDYFL